MTNISSIMTAFELYGIENESEKAPVVLRYIQLLEENRDWAGLVSRGMEKRWGAAICESIAVAARAPGEPGGTVADIGAGGGLLGIPVAIARPELEVTMIESMSRKAAFLAEVAGKLGLGNIRVANARAESLCASRTFGCVVSRAAGKVKNVAPIALGMLKQGGLYIALKATDAEEEIGESARTILESGGKFVEALQVKYPPGTAGGSGASLVVIEKL
ncbi:MAG: 16S rRNA (guanine(527)-N(7))-methyltransferase RsmG [Candidatus Geothermincolia bacterium]